MTSDSVQSLVRYLLPSGEKPIYIASQGGEQAQLSINAEFEDRLVTIHNARQLERPANLDREGFALLSHRTEIDDFYTLEDKQSAYEAELRQLLLEATGAIDLMVFDHTLRSDSPPGNAMAEEFSTFPGPVPFENPFDLDGSSLKFTPRSDPTSYQVESFVPRTTIIGQVLAPDGSFASGIRAQLFGTPELATTQANGTFAIPNARNGIVIMNRKLRKQLEKIETSLNSYQYLSSFDMWVKNLISVNTKLCKYFYPYSFLSVIIGFWFGSIGGNIPGEEAVNKLILDYPNTYLVFGLPLLGILGVILVVCVLAFFGVRIGKWDLNLVYGGLLKKLEVLCDDRVPNRLACPQLGVGYAVVDHDLAAHQHRPGGRTGAERREQGGESSGTWYSLARVEQITTRWTPKAT